MIGNSINHLTVNKIQEYLHECTITNNQAYICSETLKLALSVLEGASLMDLKLVRYTEVTTPRTRTMKVRLLTVKSNSGGTFKSAPSLLNY